MMHPIKPHHITDKMYLSRLLELYLVTLEELPEPITLKALSYDTQIPESIFLRLAHLYLDPEDAHNILPADFHILFANIKFRHPTVKMWEMEDGRVQFEV